jgi:hypothetical protein
MGLRPAEVDHDPVAEILGEVTIVARDNAATDVPVGVHQLAQFLGIET